MRLLLTALVVLSPATAQAWQPHRTCTAAPTHWATLPTVWKTRARLTGARTYYSALDDAAVRTAIRRAFDAWAAPVYCRTTFSVSDGGDTTASAEAVDQINAIEFVESTWNPALGSATTTIAATTLLWGSVSCAIIEVDQSYNAVGFTFTVTDTPAPGQIDLQSLAAHENGHWLGLGHSSTPTATMEAIYAGGIDDRVLDLDDQTGVCTLYPPSGSVEAWCANGVDDDGDHRVDCDDPDCAAAPDADDDGVCDVVDLCDGDDATGDTDGDGTCDDREVCDDADGDGVCDDEDACDGDDATGDDDGDGVCDDEDACVGDDATGDDDGDGHCASDDCDDTRADVFPGAPEACDGADNGCTGDPAVIDAACETPPGLRGCACAQGGAGPWWGALPVLAAVVRRRRARP